MTAASNVGGGVQTERRRLRATAGRWRTAVTIEATNIMNSIGIEALDVIKDQVLAATTTVLCDGRVMRSSVLHGGGDSL